MKRRKFLLGTTAAMLAWPAWLRTAFGAATCEHKPAGALRRLGDAFQRARTARRSLLVLVNPADDGEKYDRGHALGAWLNHGSNEQLAALGLCEVVCATMDELRLLVPSVGHGEPLMVLLAPNTVPATVQRLAASLPRLPIEFDRRGDWRRQLAEEAATIDLQIATYADLLSGALRLRLAGQDRAALAHDARVRVVKQRVPGSHWGLGGGCGTAIEDAPEDSGGIACGMGHVPEKSRRFLYFFARGTLGLERLPASDDE